MLSGVELAGEIAGGSDRAAPSVALPNPPSSVSIFVRDDGPGLTPEERRHVFDPFYSARQAGRGMGIGLSKAWRIVANHGGRIEVAGQPGHGAAFTVTLPRVRKPSA